jgi:hypothetical protein
MEGPSRLATDGLTPFLSAAMPDLNPRRSRSANRVIYTFYPFLVVNDILQAFPQDFYFLEGEGCLHIPTRAVLDDFVHQYFANVHPQLPVIDGTHFWELYRAENPRSVVKPRISLLLFQAMLFAASSVSKIAP